MTRPIEGLLSASGDGYLIGPGVAAAYWGELPLVEFARLLAKVEEGDDFDAAVFHFFAEHHRQDLFPYLTDCWGRGSWHSFVDPSVGGTVLDLGAGMGAISEYLSPHFSQVYSIEGCKERCRFLAVRKARKGLDNVTIINAGLNQLAFPDNSVDLVVCNGVLEWVGLGSHGPVEDVQVQMLREIRRVLKPSGLLYVGIENRWALAYMMGLPDHSGLCFTSLMPRWIAGLLVRLLKGQGSFSVAMTDSYRTYTYGHKGYQSLLGRAGFEHCDLFCVEPSYDIPAYAYPFDGDSLELARFSQLFGSRRVPWQLQRHFCSNFFLFASKSKGEANINSTPVSFGFFDRCILEGEKVIRSDRFGGRSAESLVYGRNLLHLPVLARNMITTDDVAAAYARFSSELFLVSQSVDLSFACRQLDRFLGPVISARTLERAKVDIASHHLGRLYHGDFWLGNLLQEDRTGNLVLIDREPQLFGSTALDIADFAVEYVINNRSTEGFTIDLRRLAVKFNVDLSDSGLIALSLIRQVLRYSPVHRSNVLAYRYLSLLRQWESSGIFPFEVP